GYHYAAAGGSFELLLRRETGEYAPLFLLESWRAIVAKRADGRVETEATIKTWGPPTPDAERDVRTAEATGPANALDRALRAALEYGMQVSVSRGRTRGEAASASGS